MAAKAVVEIVFGICFVLLPVKLGSIFGMELSQSGALMAQLFGTAFIFGSIVLWLARNVSISDVAARAIMTAVVISNLIGFIITLLASLAGVWNALGWLPVVLFFVFGLGFAYLLFIKKSA
jgi:drug/metabolite transporter (DMT)-like permease